MYAFIAESIAMIPMKATMVPECAKMIPDAVAMGAGEAASAAAPMLPIRAILSTRYSETTISMTRMSDRRISDGSRVSSTGMALISKPVNGQYTMITVASSPGGCKR